LSAKILEARVFHSFSEEERAEPEYWKCLSPVRVKQIDEARPCVVLIGSLVRISTEESSPSNEGVVRVLKK
jgi:hypothetical protein